MPIDLLDLGRAIKRAQFRHHRAIDGRLTALGTTLVQWDALRAIARQPGADAHTLAVATFQSDQAFGTLANRLAAAGFIERHSGRGRRIEHHLTSRGEETLAAGFPIARDVMAASAVDLSESERTALLHLLERLAADLT